MTTLEELAELRNKKFLARYGVPNYHLLDLLAETMEELADALNYMTHEPIQTDRVRLVIALVKEAGYNLHEEIVSRKGETE